MGFVTRLAPLLLAALALGCACEDEAPPKKAPPPAPRESIPLTQATWGQVRFRIPTAWKDLQRFAADGRQIIFDGPRDKGEPTISVFWAESKRTLENWAEFMRRKYDTPGGPTLVVEQGWSTVGRTRAYHIIYESDRNEVSLGPMGGSHVTIDYYFQHDGHVGFLRCTSLKPYFASVYRPLFKAVSDLQFLPAPK